MEVNHENENHEVIPGAWQVQAKLMDLPQPAGHNRNYNLTKMQREYLHEYFNSPAEAVPWQNRLCGVSATVNLTFWIVMLLFEFDLAILTYMPASFIHL